ncbi:MOSC domain-containing protein [Marinobacterium sedimentorum]|uniref:MOSC domain-containing protein n=1 Tax=Marinobacterium sedimentorum TaxID=2927804 RepID=UPI0020C7172C|nr:MOSC domain-containing protein [Marinobacterium sedimentorum]MCP8689474.1 MOSC domain-containing protein [Marinobacterium sedimentorum]
MRGQMAKLLGTLPQCGVLELILLRPSREEPMQSVTEARVQLGQGLLGDRFSGRLDSKRQITLFQAEHVAVLASLLHRESLDPALLRRNLLVRGISLHALSGRRFRIGEVVLEGAGQCHPCSRMEAVLGPGGFNAMRGIGGLCVRIIEGGNIRVGDRVQAEPELPDAP